jgi:hypothetical protein
LAIREKKGRYGVDGGGKVRSISRVNIEEIARRLGITQVYVRYKLAIS